MCLADWPAVLSAYGWLKLPAEAPTLVAIEVTVAERTVLGVLMDAGDDSLQRRLSSLDGDLLLGFDA